MESVAAQYPKLYETVRKAQRIAVVGFVLQLIGYAAWGCVMAAIALLVGQGLWQVNVWGMMGWMIALVLAGAIAYAYLRWPSKVASAGMVDEQFRLHDLISSAWAIRHDGSDMAKQVLVMAEHACSHLPKLRTSRLPVRSVLLSMMTLTVVLLGIAMTTPVGAENGNADGGVVLVNNNAQTTSAVASMTITDSARANTKEATSDAPAPGDQSTQSSQQSSDPANPGKIASNGQQRADGTGTAENLRNSGQNTAANNAARSVKDKPVGGNGLASNDGQAGANNGGSVSSANRQPTAPWNDPQWKMRKRDATVQLSNGQIPDDYRDMVRAYFQR